MDNSAAGIMDQDLACSRLSFRHVSFSGRHDTRIPIAVDVIARPPGSSPRYLERAALGLNFSPSSEIRERQ